MHPIVVSAEPVEPTAETDAPAADEDRPFTLTLVAAGIAPADIELTVKGSALKVNGRSKRTGASLGPHVYKLPRNADATRVAASQVDGLLTVTFPKKEPDGEHPGVVCDKSGQNPIVGRRYRLRGHNFDLCQSEFDKLGEREKALYDSILPPTKRLRFDVPVSDAAPMEDTSEAEEGEGERPAKAAKKYTLMVPAAGISAADLRVCVDERTLSVGGASQRTGRRLDTHQYTLPHDANTEDTTAFSVDGLLTVSVPQQLPTTIPVMDAVAVAAAEAEEKTTGGEAAMATDEADAKEAAF